MKKTLLTAVALVAMSLASCENSGNTQSGSTAVTATEQQAGAAVPEGLTGDLEADATALAERSMAISRNMLAGTDREQDTQELQQLIDKAKDYYGSRDMRDDFAIALNEKISKGVSDIAREVRTEKRDSTR